MDGAQQVRPARRCSGFPSSRPLWLLPGGASWSSLTGRDQKASTGRLCLSQLWDLPWSEAGRLGSRGRIQSFPRLCRFLSVHLL